MEHALPPAAARRRLLIPIAPRDDGRSAVRHALARAAAGECIEVFLLYVLPPAGHAGLLRFPAEQQDAEARQGIASLCLEEGAVRLTMAGVPCRTFLREGEPVQGIRDFAEEWDCAEVVLANNRRLDLLLGGQRRQLRQLQAVLPVTWVGSDGAADGEGDDGGL